MYEDFARIVAIVLTLRPDPTAPPATPHSRADTAPPAAASGSPQTACGAPARGSLYSAVVAHNSSRPATSLAGRRVPLIPLPAAVPPTPAPPSIPPSLSGLNWPLPAAALTVLETGDHSPIGYRLSVTRACPLLGLTSKKSTASCHAAEPALPQLLDTPGAKGTLRGLICSAGLTVTEFSNAAAELWSD